MQAVPQILQQANLISVDFLIEFLPLHLQFQLLFKQPVMLFPRLSQLLHLLINFLRNDILHFLQLPLQQFGARLYQRVFLHQVLLVSVGVIDHIEVLLNLCFVVGSYFEFLDDELFLVVAAAALFLETCSADFGKSVVLFYVLSGDFLLPLVQLVDDVGQWNKLRMFRVVLPVALKVVSQSFITE